MKKKSAWVLCLDEIRYEDAFDLQKKLVDARSSGKIKDTLVLLEHSPVFTANRNETFKNILAPKEIIESKGIQICKTDRGGDVTYHGPGQVVGYNIMDLNDHGRDLHAYIRSIEQLLIDTLEDYGIKSGRDRKHPGVWVGNEKIAAIGIAVKKGWISMHGFALNVKPDMEHYKMIIPCGITDRGVTSMSLVLGRTVCLNEIQEKLVEHYGRIFCIEPEKIRLGDLPWL